MASAASSFGQTRGKLIYLSDVMLHPAQPRHRSSPSNARHSTPSYDSTDFQDVDTSMGHDPMVSATFIEAVAQSMGFSSGDEEYRSSLHSIPKVCHARMTVQLNRSQVIDRTRYTKGAPTALYLSDRAHVCNTQRKPCHCRFVPC